MTHTIGESRMARPWHGSTKEEPMNSTIVFALVAVLIGGVVTQVIVSELVSLANMFPS